MGYVFSKELGTENGISYSIEIFKEGNKNYRPILTAEDDDFGMGFSNRRSFVSEELAKKYFNENAESLKKEALSDLQNPKNFKHG